LGFAGVDDDGVDLEVRVGLEIEIFLQEFVDSLSIDLSVLGVGTAFSVDVSELSNFLLVSKWWVIIFLILWVSWDFVELVSQIAKNSFGRETVGDDIFVGDDFALFMIRIVCQTFTITILSGSL
jgi:hypothetical protein